MHDVRPESAIVATPRENDLVQPFLLESSGIRGDFVRLGPALDRILSRHAYPEPLSRLLGEMLALTAMLASLLKYEGVFSLQTKSDGPVGLMVADMTSEGNLRGYAGFESEKLEAALARLGGATREPPGVPELLGSGYLAFTADPRTGRERYQGIVELSGDSLADCLQHYFRQSEQIQTGLIAAAERIEGTWRAAGLVLQRLPEEAARAARTRGIDEDAWRRAMILQASCTKDELLDPELPANDLLYRLFHEEGVRVFRRRAVQARCRCSRERLVKTLRAMTRERVEEFKVGGEVVVTCEFCNTVYRFDSNALDAIYRP